VGTFRGVCPFWQEELRWGRYVEISLFLNTFGCLVPPSQTVVRSSLVPVCLSGLQQTGSVYPRPTFEWQQPPVLLRISTSFLLASSVSIVTRLLAGRPGFDSRQPDRLSSIPTLLSNGYQGHFPWGQSGRSVKLTTHLCLAPRLMRGAIPPLLRTS
jgi:hypothetical protein